jgi:hypothetical protein
VNTKIAVAALACAALQACAAGGDPSRVVGAESAPTQALVRVAELHELTRATPWECANYDEADRTCEAVARTTWRDDRHGTSRVVVLLVEAPRVTAMLTTPTWAEGDRECGRTAETSVEVVSDTVLPEGAAEKIKAATRRKLATREGRAVTCARLVRDGDHFRVASRHDGRPFGRGNRLRLFAEPPALRVPDRRV